MTPFLLLVDCQNNDDLGASIGLENDDDLFLWNVTFEGPEDSLYEVSVCLSKAADNCCISCVYLQQSSLPNLPENFQKILNQLLLNVTVGRLLQDLA